MKWAIAALAAVTLAMPATAAAAPCRGDVVAANQSTAVLRVSRRIIDVCWAPTGHRIRVIGPLRLSGFQVGTGYVLFRSARRSGALYSVVDPRTGRHVVVATETRARHVYSARLLANGRTVIGIGREIRVGRPLRAPRRFVAGSVNAGSAAVDASGRLYWLDRKSRPHSKPLPRVTPRAVPASAHRAIATGQCGGRVLAAGNGSRVLAGRQGPVLCRHGRRTKLAPTASGFAIHGHWLRYLAGTYIADLFRTDAADGATDEPGIRGPHTGYSGDDVMFADGTVVYSNYGGETQNPTNSIWLAPVHGDQRMLAEAPADSLDMRSLAASDPAGVVYWSEADGPHVDGVR